MAIDFPIAKQFQCLPTDCVSPRWSALPESRSGIVAGVVAAYAAQSRTWLRSVALSYVEVVRNIPYLIFVYLSFFGLPKLGLGASATTVAVGCTAFYTGGYFCEIMRAALRSVPRGQTHAALSTARKPVRTWL